MDGYEITHAAQRPVLDALRGYAENLPREIARGTGVTLFGPCGVGKDFLAVALARAAIAAGVDVQAISGQDLFGMARDRMDAAGLPESALVAQYVRPPVLLLSDPSPPAGSISDYQSALLFRIIDKRYRDLRPTWSTLNVASGGEADNRLTAPISDRLRDGSLCLFCNWPSFRRPRVVGTAGDGR